MSTTTASRPFVLRPFPSSLLAGLVLAVIVAALWLPFGLKTSGTTDTWRGFYEIEQGMRPPVVLSLQELRPFTFIPWYAAYLMDRGSFVGLNLLLMALLFGKGFVFYHILRRLLPLLPAGFALGIAALATAHPADPHAIFVSAIGGQLGIFCFLLSVYLLLAFVDNGRWPLLAGALVVSLFSMGFSERTYPLVLLVPLLVIYKTRGVNRRMLTAVGAWLLVTFAVFAVYILAFTSDTYKRSDNLSNATFNPLTLMEREIRAVERVLVTGWLPPAEPVPSAWWLIIVGTGSLVGGSVWFFSREKVAPTAFRPRPHLLLLIAAGLVVIGAGFAAFAPLNFYGQSFWRALYLSVFGGALVLGGTGYLLFSYLPASVRPLVFAILCGGFTALGVLNLLFNHQAVYQDALAYHATLAAISRQAPGLGADSALILVTENGSQVKAAGIDKLNDMPDVLEVALGLIYGRPVRACVFIINARRQCEITPAGVQMTAGAAATFAHERTIVLRYDGRGRLTPLSAEEWAALASSDDALASAILARYNPAASGLTEAAHPSRYTTMLMGADLDSAATETSD